MSVSQAEPAPPLARAVEGSDRGWHSQTLEQALGGERARRDQAGLCVVAFIELCILLAGLAKGTMSAWGLAVTAGVVGLELAALALAAAWPQRYTRRWRLPLMTVTRMLNMVAYPAAIDLLSIMTGQPVKAGAAAGGMLATAAATAHAIALLMVPVSGVHACMLVAIYWQLPPWIHLAVQSASVGVLMFRAPAVCHQFVAAHPINGKVAEWAHWLLRQVVSTLCLGTRMHLEAAADSSGPVEKCTAVAWVLEASLGLVLSTLLLWRQQLREAREHTARRQQAAREQAQRQASTRSQAATVDEAEEELCCSQYARLCQPVLETVDAYGGWAVPVVGAGLLGFIAALLSRAGMEHD